MGMMAQASCSNERRSMGLSLALRDYSTSLVPDRGQFLAVGDERGAFVQFGSIEPEYLVVGAGIERDGGGLVRVLAFPDADAVERPDDHGSIIIGEADGDAAAVAIDGADDIGSGRDHGFRR